MKSNSVHQSEPLRTGLSSATEHRPAPDQREPINGQSVRTGSSVVAILGPDHQYRADGLLRAHWSNATPIRAIFRQAFTAAGLPYANPHSFRKTLTQLGERLCQTPEEFKAWSQNLGHEQVLTTFSSYGNVCGDRQAELIRRLGQKSQPPTFDRVTIDRVMQALKGANAGNA
jgi:hypothetical protein